jgi:long-chain acyl-CoA synthetase
MEEADMIRDYFADREEIDFPNFRKLLDSSVERYPGRTALRQRAGGEGFREISYRELGQRVRRFSAALFDRGLQKGDRLGLLSENRTEWMEVYLAAVTTGVVIVPFDAGSEPSSVVSYARFADLSGMVFSGRFLETALEAGRHLRGRKPPLVCFDRPEEGLPAGRKGILSYEEELSSRGEEGREMPEPAPEDPAAIIFTSGTTGTPKGVTLSQHGIIANVNASIMSLPIDEEDNFIAVLPFHHTYPTTCSFLSPLSVGGAVTVVDKIVGQRIIADTRDSGGTVLIGVPLLFDKLKRGIAEKLGRLPPGKRKMIGLFRRISRAGLAVGLPTGVLLFRGLRRKAGLDSLRLLVAGGGPLAAETADFFSELGFTIVQGYGMSENGPLITANTEKHCDNRTVGLPVKYTDIRIAEPNADGVGEVQVTSPSLMLGYFRNGEATEEAMTPDGYLHTGDLGFFDSRGFLSIVGRSKNLIVTAGGKNVYPEEVESHFADSPVIAEVMVLGQRRPDGRGERVAAVCVPDYERLREQRGGSLPPQEEISRMVREEVSRVNRGLSVYEKIESVYLREEEFEKTASGKIKRFLYGEYAEQK